MEENSSYFPNQNNLLATISPNLLGQWFPNFVKKAKCTYDPLLVSTQATSKSGLFCQVYTYKEFDSGLMQLSKCSYTEQK